MSANASFVAHVSEQLASLGGLSDGKFFGGHAFKSHGVQFAMVMGNTLYFCVNDVTRKDYIERGSGPFSYTTKTGLVEVRKYYAAPESLLEDPSELLLWAAKSIQAARGTR